MTPNPTPLTLRDIFAPPPGAALRQEIRTEVFARTRWDVPDHGSVKLDEFPDAAGVSCSFVRLEPGKAATIQLALEGAYGMARSRSGGWLLEPVDPDRATYWIPRTPTFRIYDRNDRILSEVPALLAGFMPGSARSTFEFESRRGAMLECAVWHFPREASDFVAAFEQSVELERQAIFMLASHSPFCGPADVYACLLHGHVYENRFDERRQRKICSELEAYAIYLALHGLEAATGKKLYGLLKRQIVFSVIARQTADGGWQHGEWTDFMESHYRFHNAAMLMLEAAYAEAPNVTVAEALGKAAAVLSGCTDQTDLGVWFFHDSLEHSVELTDKSGIQWIPGRELGKAPATKMILNSHLDAIVTMDRYREVSGDNRYEALVASALTATRKLLALRPAEWLYGPLYRAVGLTLLPETAARQLPFALRALKRVTRIYVLPQLHRVKRRFPRMVMPGGLIERHLSRLHFGVNYHSVNLMDLARLWRRFPREDFGDVVNGAIAAVTETALLSYWIEAKQRQALGYWVEALFHLCTLSGEHAYRRHLANAILGALDAGLGLPPSLLGAHPEVVTAAERFPCPSPMDPNLRIANLSCRGGKEILVVNPTATTIELAFENGREREFGWKFADERPVTAGDSRSSVPARGWLVGRGS